MLTKARALMTSALTTLILIASAVVISGPASAAPSSSASALASAPRPCGRPHYPPCPPKSSVSVSPHNVRRGHHLFISVRHYPAHKHVSVHLAGHGIYRSLGSTRTGRHGNANLRVTIPKHISRGKYTLYVMVGSATKTFHIRVIRG
jgi:hypothetical protein